MADILPEFQEALLSVDAIKTKRILAKAKEEFTPAQLIETLIVNALEEIGEGWATGAYSLSQVYMSGRICEELVDSLLPPGSGWRESKPKMAIALLNDYHALGKRIVYSVLRAGGFDLLDYGRVDTDGLVHRIKHDSLEVILLSVLMFPSALHVKDVRKMLDDEGCDVKIVVGGAPFRLDRDLWREVGADAVGYTASDAIGIIQSIAKGSVL